MNGRPKGCRIILIGDSSGGNLVLGTARWLRDENLLPPPDGLLLLSVRRSRYPIACD
jgi:acetyl esterase/lipase